MSRIARCPHCKKQLIGVDKTPSQLKVEAAKNAAAKRRYEREVETDVRRWYAADFKIVYEAVHRTKMNQSNPDKAVSKVLFESILQAHRNKLNTLEEEITLEVGRRLKER